MSGIGAPQRRPRVGPPPVPVPVNPSPSPSLPGAESEVAPPRRRWWAVPWCSPEGQPGWARPVLLALAAASAVLYGWRLNGNGLHEYYAPAVKSMSVSWTAFVYG